MIYYNLLRNNFSSWSIYHSDIFYDQCKAWFCTIYDQIVKSHKMLFHGTLNYPNRVFKEPQKGSMESFITQKDYSKNSKRFFYGTLRCPIWFFKESQKVLLGHPSCLCGFLERTPKCLFGVYWKEPLRVLSKNPLQRTLPKDAWKSPFGCHHSTTPMNH